MSCRVPRLVLLLVALCLLAGCQIDLTVDIRLNDDGSGRVTVGAGLDDDALARTGNLERQLRADDLRAAGWDVSGPVREGDLTWVRASKAFTTPDEAGVVLAEVTGDGGPFRDFAVRVDEGMVGRDYAVTGTVDLTQGPQAFGDDELSAALGGDPFGGTLEAIEREEGRPISEMVEFHVSVELPGTDAPTVYTPSFTDAQPTEISATSSQRSSVASFAIWGLVALVGVIALVALRKGFKRINR